MSRDDSLIEETMETLSKLDDFMNQLYKIYLIVKNEGSVQTASLGIHRNDYLLHAEEGADAKSAKIQQVEFNTISASFMSLSHRTSELHRYLLSSLKGYAGDQIEMNQLPVNKAIDTIANGLAVGWKHYNKPSAYVAMIVQSGERNAFDQRWIEYSLLENHNVHLVRLSLEDIADRATLDPETKALMIDGLEIAVTYYRAGYGPEDYHSQKEWDARLIIERSLSIKCPTVAYQLVGSKKVQQVLAEPGRLERYVDQQTADDIRESFAGLYPLDSSPEGLAAYEKALSQPENLVMKPQREGGGHNIYGQDILTELKKLKPEERNAYILMDLIRSPPLDNYMIREGQVISGQVVSELGIYGIFLGDGDKQIFNHTDGHLLRTKAITTREGGVAAGFAVIDSPLLV
ncbi:glutathione synthetase [Blakeslea trispora]|nr:glutathione synthetase [Blakeslea trispora]